MKLEKSILIIDNRSILIQSIKYLLNVYFEKEFNLKYYICSDYFTALYRLEKLATANTNMDFIILNVDINYKNYYGLVLVKKYVDKIKDHFPRVKIIISTSRNENYRINQIITNNNPFGIIIENKTSENDLLKMFIKTFNDEVYYPKYVDKIIDKYKINYFEITEIEFYILYLLKQGIKTNYLQHYIPRSNSTIEKMKSSLKDKLVLMQRSDDKLVKEAIKKGFLNKYEYCKNYSY